LLAIGIGSSVVCNNNSVWNIQRVGRSHSTERPGSKKIASDGIREYAVDGIPEDRKCDRIGIYDLDTYWLAHV